MKGQRCASKSIESKNIQVLKAKGEETVSEQGMMMSLGTRTLNNVGLGPQSAD